MTIQNLKRGNGRPAKSTTTALISLGETGLLPQIKYWTTFVYGADAVWPPTIHHFQTVDIYVCMIKTLILIR